MTPSLDVADLAGLVTRVALDVVLPQHRRLAATDVEEKSPGELVTWVDREAERQLADGLRALLPGVPVVGEEAASTDPALLGALQAAPLVWLVDPLDGTSNFVAGSEDFAVMVALVRQGETVAAVIARPAEDRVYVAELGAGAGVDYPLVAEGVHDFVLFWRTLPWDHAPGALLVTEAGGFAGHLEGARYRPGTERSGLLVVADLQQHEQLVEVLWR